MDDTTKMIKIILKTKCTVRKFKYLPKQSTVFFNKINKEEKNMKANIMQRNYKDYKRGTILNCV